MLKSCPHVVWTILKRTQISHARLPHMETAGPLAKIALFSPIFLGSANQFPAGWALRLRSGPTG
jgi:hypothetical protein